MIVKIPAIKKPMQIDNFAKLRILGSILWPWLMKKKKYKPHKRKI